MQDFHICMNVPLTSSDICKVSENTLADLSIWRVQHTYSKYNIVNPFSAMFHFYTPWK